MPARHIRAEVDHRGLQMQHISFKSVVQQFMHLNNGISQRGTRPQKTTVETHTCNPVPLATRDVERDIISLEHPLPLPTTSPVWLHVQGRIAEVERRRKRLMRGLCLLLPGVK